jgi:hypothetical protein
MSAHYKYLLVAFAPDGSYILEITGGIPCNRKKFFNLVELKVIINRIILYIIAKILRELTTAISPTYKYLIKEGIWAKW